MSLDSPRFRLTACLRIILYGPVASAAGDDKMLLQIGVVT